MSDSSDPHTTPTVVTLVHGTNAREARWANDDNSIIRTAIRRQLGPDVIFQVFNWSGWNSHQARYKGGIKLARHQSESCASFPNSNHFIIAHSHGGNVALYGLKNDRPENIKGVITLATPFFQCKPREIFKNQLFAFILCSIVFYLIIFFAIMGMWYLLDKCVFSLLGFYFTYSENPSREGGSIYYDICNFICPSKDYIFPGSVIGILVVMAHWKKIKAELLRYQDRIVETVKCPLPSVPLLSFHVEKDEAKAFLSMINWISGLPYFFWTRRVAVILYFIGASGGGRHMYYYPAQTPFGSDPLPVTLWSFVIFPMMGVMYFIFLNFILMILIPAVLRSHPLAYGGEGLLFNLLTNINIKNHPYDENHDFADRIIVSKRPYFGLRHSLIYDKENVADQIAAWIKEQSDAVPHISRPSPQTAG